MGVCPFVRVCPFAHCARWCRGSRVAPRSRLPAGRWGPSCPACRLGTYEGGSFVAGLSFGPEKLHVLAVLHATAESGEVRSLLSITHSASLLGLPGCGLVTRLHCSRSPW